LSQRQYQLCAASPQTKHCAQIPDASYLVEPVAGVWLLVIDANIYRPGLVDGQLQFAGSGQAGYNAMVEEKPQTLAWIRSVVTRAKQQGKKLIAFSHFPMTEFYQQQAPALHQFIGAGKGQLDRVPRPDVAQVLADTGLRVHVAGHMHLNNTGIVSASDGGQLVNIQAPSLASYRPAYKLLTLAGDRLRVDTIALQQVAGFDQLFPMYRLEWQQLQQQGLPLWDERLLQSRSYQQFTSSYLRELTRLRFLPQDWPQPFADLMLQLSGQQLLQLALMPKSVSVADYRVKPQLLQQWLHSSDATALAATLQRQAEAAGLNWLQLSQWRGLDLAVDFYRLQNAGELARVDLSAERLAHYRFIASQLKAVHSLVWSDAEQQPLATYTHSRLALLLQMVDGFAQGTPNLHFVLDLPTGKLQD